MPIAEIYPLAMTLLLVWTAILLMPGPDFIMMLGATLNQGRRHAWSTGLGITAAVALYIAVVIAGFEQLSQHPQIYQAVQYVGAVYLLYLGVRVLWRQSGALSVAAIPVSRSHAASFWQGFLCNLFNPKAPILIGSIFSQLIGAAVPLVWKSILGLEMLVINGIVWGLFPLVMQMAPLQRWLLTRLSWVNNFLGLALCAMGVWAFL